MRRSTVCVLALLVGSLFVAGTTLAQSDDGPSRTISVQGEGTVRVAPDRAVVRFGIVSEAETAEAARSQNADAAARAMNAVRDLGIPDNRIRMEALQLQPRREYNPETRQREDKGYEATRQIVVEVDSLDRLPVLVTRVVQEGANRLSGIQYDLSDRDAIRNDALREAAEAARAKADLLATTLGATLGPVQEIREQSFSFPRPMMRMEAAAMKTADQAAPQPDAYAAGEIEVSASVQVTFFLQ
jgi:uncharacterized protein YggE